MAASTDGGQLMAGEIGRPARRTSSKGHRRKKLLVTAARELLMERGFAAVSHRSVAERAELPLSATTYYFSSLDDLLAEALDGLADDWFDQARAAVESLPARLDDTDPTAAAILSVSALAPAGGATAGSKAVLVLYERYLEAARHPSLRAAIAAYDHRLEGLIEEILRRADLRHDPTSARLVLAVLDGAMLRALAEGEELPTVKDLLKRMLERLRG